MPAPFVLLGDSRLPPGHQALLKWPCFFLGGSFIKHRLRGGPSQDDLRDTKRVAFSAANVSGNSGRWN